jgi:hypothetical protein
MSNKNSSSSSGVGFFGLMFLIFMTLKLTGYITWSWWWVTAPLWGGFAVIITIILLVLLVQFLNR